MSELRKWEKKAEKALKNERENIYQEWIDWLTYDYNKSDNPNLLSLIHFFERLGSNQKDGINKIYGLFGFTDIKEENDLRRTRENALVRKVGGTLRKEDYIKKWTLYAEADFAASYFNGSIDTDQIYGEELGGIKVLGKLGYSYEDPGKFHRFLVEKEKERKRRKK